jgi:hypothetical protein
LTEDQAQWQPVTRGVDIFSSATIMLVSFNNTIPVITKINLKYSVLGMRPEV